MSTLKEIGPKAEKRLRAVVRKAENLPGLKKICPESKWTPTVTLVGSEKMRILNRAYRGKNRPTDILSFSSPEPFFSQGNLGELVICLPVAKKQAKEFSQSLEQELTVLLAHGLLHLLGFSHKKMKGWELKILSSLVPKKKSLGLIARNR